MRERMQKMSDIADKNTFSNQVLSGTLGTYKLIEEIGHGGSGTVYTVDVVTGQENLPDSETGYVAKILTLKNVKDDNKKRERKDRFKREISHVIDLQERIEGIMPIIDYNFEDEEDDHFNWYLMPRAKEFRYWQKKSFEKKLEQMHYVAKTIRNVHALGIVHRDIKPSNLLYYKGTIYITDFGLVWSEENDDHLTQTGEALGPYNIRPPEFEGGERREGIDYKKSDTYLYAKTLWIVLTGKRNGFYGEYNRREKQIYIDKSVYGIKSTLEPIHQLLEAATRDQSDVRADIEDCLRLMETQNEIFAGHIDQNSLRKLQYKETIQEANASLGADSNVYDEPSKIVEILNGLSEIVNVLVYDFGKEYDLGNLRDVEQIQNHLFQVNTRRFNRMGRKVIKSYQMVIESIQIDKNNKCMISIRQLQSAHENITSYSNIREAIESDNKQVFIDGTYTAILKTVG